MVLELLERLEKLISKNCVIKETELRPEFRDLPNFCGNFTVERTDFTDLEWASRPAIKLIELNFEQICKLGEYFLSSVRSGTPCINFAAVLILAFQLRAPGVGNTSRVFPTVLPSEFDVSGDATYNELNDILEGQVCQNRVSNAKAYAFIAASMLRLFTQSPENYCRAWNNIRIGFETFYKERFPIAGFTPCVDAMKIMQRQFSFDYKLKAALYRILYMSNESKDHEVLKKFLYDTHLLYTGMHIVPIFCQLRDALNVDSYTLLTPIFGGEFDRQIRSLAQVLYYMENSTREHARHMWRYGRIFESSFMASLQTKSYPRLVYLLALALKKERPEEAKNILGIKQFENVSVDYKKRCELAADIFLREVKMNSRRIEE